MVYLSTEQFFFWKMELSPEKVCSERQFLQLSNLSEYARRIVDRNSNLSHLPINGFRARKADSMVVGWAGCVLWEYVAYLPYACMKITSPPSLVHATTDEAEIACFSLHNNCSSTPLCGLVVMQELCR